MSAASSLPTTLVECITFQATDDALPPRLQHMHGATVSRLGLGSYRVDLGATNQIDPTDRSVQISQAGGPAFAVRNPPGETDRFIDILTFSSAAAPADTTNLITVEVKRITSG